MNEISFLSDILPSLLFDCFDSMVLVCILLSVIAIFCNRITNRMLFILVPSVATLGFYHLVPEWMYHQSHWFLVAWFVGVMLLAPHQWAPKPTRNNLPRLFLTLAIGIFILRAGFWNYILFNSAFDEKPGSFRLKGVVWGEQQAIAWRFDSLHELIMQHWYYPNEEERYIKPYPENANELLASGLSDAETFRQSLLKPNDDGVLPAELIALGILEFQKESRSALQNRPGLEKFDLGKEDIVEAIRGYTFKLNPEYKFEPFQGKWYGEWDGNPVDHEWRHVEFYDPPKPMGEPSVNVEYLQYAWIGDGFGWNIIASQKQDETLRHFILGTVFHIENNDLEQIYLTRPHVGVVGVGPEENKIIWITKGEIFLEEAFPRYYKEEERYAITGFFYERTDTTLKNKGQAFQAIYTRKPDQRPDFYKFDVDVRIDPKN